MQKKKPNQKKTEGIPKKTEKKKILKQASKPNRPNPAGFRHSPIKADYGQGKVFQGHQTWMAKYRWYKQTC